MDTQSIIEQIDSEISRLTQARALLANLGKTATAKVPTKRRAKRKLSAEARKRIADAQRARWAKVRAKKK